MAAASFSTISITGLSCTVPETIRPLRSSAVGLEQVVAVGAVDHRLVELDRDALRRGRQAMHLRLRVPPVGGDRHGLARLGNGQRTGEFRGQHGRLPDVRRDQHIPGLDRERRLVRLSTRRRHRRSATRCRTEIRRWSASRRCRRARPWPRAPSSRRSCVRRRRRRNTRRRPKDRASNDQQNDQDGRPAAAPWNGYCLDHPRCEARRMRRFKGCTVFSRRGRCPDDCGPDAA